MTNAPSVVRRESYDLTDRRVVCKTQSCAIEIGSRYHWTIRDASCRRQGPPLAHAELPDWRDSAVTFQLWTQVVGKVRLALSPWLNHGWHVPLYVNVRGLTARSSMPARAACRSTSI